MSVPPDQDRVFVELNVHALFQKTKVILRPKALYTLSQGLGGEEHSCCQSVVMEDDLILAGGQ